MSSLRQGVRRCRGRCLRAAGAPCCGATGKWEEWARKRTPNRLRPIVQIVPKPLFRLRSAATAGGLWPSEDFNQPGGWFMVFKLKSFTQVAAGAVLAAGLAAPAFAQETVKIGLIVPLTGGQASTGKQIDNAIKLY